jgi:putative ABC transport system permease protein
MDTFAYDIRYAIRALLHVRRVAATAILTLTLGIAATTTMFGVAWAALKSPLPFADSDRLLVLYLTRATAQDGTLKLRWSNPAIAALRALGLEPLEDIASFTATNVGSSGNGQAAEQIDGEVVSAGYFSALRITPSIGRAFRADEDAAPGARPVAVLSDRFWRRRFAADPAVVGRATPINGIALTVVGVAPAGFSGLSGRSDIWIPRAMAPQLTYSDYLTTPQHFVNVVARLAPGETLERANAALATVGPRLKDTNGPAGAVWSALAMPLSDARVDPTVRRSTVVLLGASVCVLLTACVNVAGLLLARAHMRRREVAVRLAMGATRARLVRQLVAESLLLAGIAGVAALPCASAAMDALGRAAPAVIASFRNDHGAFAPFATPHLDARVFLFTLALTVAATFICAIAPALHAARADVVEARNARGGSARRRGLTGLVAGQIAAAVLLLAGAGLLLDSFERLQHQRAGFVSDHVLTFWIRPPNTRYRPSDGPAIVERMLNRIEAVPGVVSAAVNRCTPFMGCARTTVDTGADPLGSRASTAVGRHYVSDAYFRTLAIPLIAGRTLAPTDRPGRAAVAVVNETAVRRFWPERNPIGQRVIFGPSTGFSNPPQPVEIVGVVGDVKYEGVDEPTNADFYTSYLQFAYPDTMVIVKLAGEAASVARAIGRAVSEVDDTVAIFDVQMLDDRIDLLLSRPRFNAAVVVAFALVAVGLAAVGVYGTLAYWVSTRTREIGIRSALGADGASLVRLVVGHGLRIASGGVAIGLVASAGAAALLRGWLVGVTSSPPLVLAGAAALMFAAVAAASLPAALRARGVDPAAMLRSE